MMYFSNPMNITEKLPTLSGFTMHEVMETIIVILNARDPYTFEHSWRVSALCENIVKNMDIPEQWQEVIHIAAHLHDIGKIGVPDLVLNKQERLTEEEFEMIKNHSKIGYDIVNSLPKLNEIALYILHHHERWDGRGYPFGLKGKEIPFGARIIAVADTFDAITSSRPYSKAHSYEEALEEIKNVSGFQLCPEVSEAFLDLKEEIPSILSKVNHEIAARNLI